MLDNTQLVDSNVTRDSQNYGLTNTYRVPATGGATYTIRVRIRVNSYDFQSWAIAEVLTPALTWTEVAQASNSAWYSTVPSPYARDLNPTSALTPLAAQLFERACVVLGITDYGPRVIRMLDLSTSHLPDHLGIDGLNSIDGVKAYRVKYGWLLWVPDDPEQHAAGYEADPDLDVVLAIWRYARALGCDYVLLDRDADTIDDLPTWAW